jgi:hypothetical protein
LFLFFIANLVSAGKLSYQTEQRVFAKAGNIYYIQPSGQIVQVTHSRRDSYPALSKNKKMIAFIRIGNQIIPEKCDVKTGAKYGNQIWLYDISAKNERLLVANNFECDEPEKKIIDPSNLCFSPANNTIYFVTSAWTTSGALHRVDVANAVQRYIAPANEFKIISKGDNRGSLIVSQHRYFIGGGSYDWYWLISPEGKEEGPLGPEITKEQIDFIESDR